MVCLGERAEVGIEASFCWQLLGTRTRCSNLYLQEEKRPGFHLAASLLAERAGFEPAIRLRAYTLSKRAPSTTRTPLLVTTHSKFRFAGWRSLHFSLSLFSVFQTASLGLKNWVKQQIINQ